MTNERVMTNYRIHSVRNWMLALLLVPVSPVLGAEVCDTSWYSGEGTQYGGVAGVMAEIAASMLTRPTITIAP